MDQDSTLVMFILQDRVGRKIADNQIDKQGLCGDFLSALHVHSGEGKTTIGLNEREEGVVMVYFP